MRDLTTHSLFIAGSTRRHVQTNLLALYRALPPTPRLSDTYPAPKHLPPEFLRVIRIYRYPYFAFGSKHINFFIANPKGLTWLTGSGGDFPHSIRGPSYVGSLFRPGEPIPPWFALLRRYVFFELTSTRTWWDGVTLQPWNVEEKIHAPN